MSDRRKRRQPSRGAEGALVTVIAVVMAVTGILTVPLMLAERGPEDPAAARSWEDE